jgi:hypothetical protein
VFSELQQTRFYFHPYATFTSWDDQGLWEKVLTITFPRYEFPPSIDQLKRFIYLHWVAYQQDNTLMSFSIDLKQALKMVFDPLTDTLSELGGPSMSNDSLGPLQLKYEYEVTRNEKLVLEHKCPLPVHSSGRRT